MDNKKNGIPKLRFPGFTGAWEQRKVSELLEERTEKAPENKIYPLMAFIANKGVAPKGDRYDRAALVKDAKNKKYKRTKLGDFIYSSNNLETGSIGLNNYGNASISPVYSIFKPTGIANSDFIGRRFVRKDFINLMIRWRQGVVYGQWRIHEKDFLRIDVSVPSLKEQQKIGNFLSDLDSLITLHQRKLEHLQEQKKGLLQKMFPKNGETVPEVRFPGFTDAWEQRKLGEVADIFDGTHQTPKYTDSGIKFVSVENIATLETEKYISQKAYESEYSNKQAEKGDVLMTRIGNIGTPKLIEKDEPLAYYVTLALLKPKNIDSNFLAWGISSPKVQRNIWKLTLHIAFPKKINLGEINQVSISIPSINEQKKIGDFFKQLDSLIALHQRKLDHLELMKKGLLQQMFV